MHYLNCRIEDAGRRLRANALFLTWAMARRSERVVPSGAQADPTGSWWTQTAMDVAGLALKAAELHEDTQFFLGVGAELDAQGFGAPLTPSRPTCRRSRTFCASACARRTARRSTAQLRANVEAELAARLAPLALAAHTWLFQGPPHLFELPVEPVASFSKAVAVYLTDGKDAAYNPFASEQDAHGLFRVIVANAGGASKKTSAWYDETAGQVTRMRADRDLWRFGWGEPTGATLSAAYQSDEALRTRRWAARVASAYLTLNSGPDRMLDRLRQILTDGYVQPGAEAGLAAEASYNGMRHSARAAMAQLLETDVSTFEPTAEQAMVRG